jgi:hypothetical protein
MPNAIKYKTGNLTGSLQKSNVALGATTASIVGPTSTTGWYNGITPQSGKYIVFETDSGFNPRIYAPQTDAELIRFVRSKGATGANTASLSSSLAWIGTQTNLMAANFEYENIVTNGLVLNLDAGFVGSYPTTASTWYDLSGNGFNGTLTNGPTFNSANSGSIVFDGTNDYVSIPNPLNQLNLSQVWSVGAWVNLNSGTSGPQYIISGLNNGVASDWYGNGPLLYLNGGVNDYYTYTSTYASIAGTGWRHLVYLFQNSTGLRQIYKDGVLAGSSVGPNNTSTPSGQGGTWYIGQMAGLIGVIQVYNRVLSPTEITQNYNAQKSRFGL